MGGSAQAGMAGMGGSAQAGMAGMGGTGGMAGMDAGTDTGAPDAGTDAKDSGSTVDTGADAKVDGGSDASDSSVTADANDSSVTSDANDSSVTSDTGSDVSTDVVAETSSTSDSGDGSGGICPTGKSPPVGTTCSDCEDANCTHNAAGCSTTGCTAQPACSDYPAAADQALCQAVQDCAHKTDCARNGVSTCFCGTKSVADCKAGLGDGACMAEIAAGLKTTDPNFVLSNIVKVSLPGGGAMSLILCDHDFCGDLNGANNECLPYCK
jgi:hypothetical protein